MSVARRLPLIAAALATMIWAQVAAPPAAACSCVEPQPMAAYGADPRMAVLTGVPGPLQARGVPVQVTGWFKGPGAAAIVWLAAGSFDTGVSSCAVGPPGPGDEFIFVLWMPEDGTDPGTGLCTPTARLSGAEGRAMLADAVATFGRPATTFGQPVSPSEPVDVVSDLAPALAVIGAGALTLALVIAGLTLASRRRGAPTDPPRGL